VNGKKKKPDIFVIYIAVIVMRSWEQLRLNAYFFQMNINIPLPSYTFYYRLLITDLMLQNMSIKSTFYFRHTEVPLLKIKSSGM
jgi:hypothetical protein